MQYLENIPDSAKLIGAGAAPVLTFLGVSVEQWGYVVSAIVGVLFIIEKLPTVANNIRMFVNWIKRYVKQRKDARQ